MTDYEELPPRFKEALLTKTKANSPFWSLLDMDLIDVKKGYARTRIPYSKKLHNANGTTHGGVNAHLICFLIILLYISIPSVVKFINFARL